MFKAHKEDIPRILDWIKSVITIASAGIVAIAISTKLSIPVQTHLKAAAAFFGISIILLLSASALFINHEHSESNFIRKSHAFVFLLGYAAFLASLGILIDFVISQ